MDKIMAQKLFFNLFQFRGKHVRILVFLVSFNIVEQISPLQKNLLFQVVRMLNVRPKISYFKTTVKGNFKRLCSCFSVERHHMLLPMAQFKDLFLNNLAFRHNLNDQKEHRF